MALFTCEDLSNETITTPAKEILCTTKIATKNVVRHSLEFRHTHDMEDHESIIATESSQEASLHHSTMESEIDQTAELLPSGSIQSLQNGIKRAVTETSPLPLTGSFFIPKNSDYQLEEEPSLSVPKYFQTKPIVQQSRTESIQWIPASLEPESGLDIGEIEPHSNVTADLYSIETCGKHVQTPDFTENIKQNVDFLSKSDDYNNEDLYTDSKFFEGKNISNISEYMKELSREIPSKMEMTDDIMLKNKVWNRPAPENIYRKRMDYRMRCTKKGEYIETGHTETDEGTFMRKSAEHESQANSALYPHALTSRYVPMLHGSNATDNIKLKSSLKQLQDSMIKDDFIGEQKACHKDQKAKSDDRISKEVNQCEGEPAIDKTQTDDAYLKRINKQQKLEMEIDALKAFDENADSKETYNNFSGITSISKVPSSPVTFLSLEGISNVNGDKPPQSSSEILSYIEENQSLAQLNISTCASHEDKISCSRDKENQPQSCSNNDNIETHDDRKGAIKINYFEAGNGKTNQLEFQKDFSTMCPEKVDTGDSTAILKELSISQSQEIGGISPGNDLISSDKRITLKDSTKSSQKVGNDIEIKILFESCSEEKLAPFFNVIDQQDHVSLNTLNINKHHSMGDSSITEVKIKPCHSPVKNSETPYRGETPEKEVESDCVQETKRNKDNNDSITGSHIISNESHQINNLQVFSRSSDPSINSSDLSCESTITLNNSLYQCTATISDLTNWCTINPLDPSKECRNTVQESDVKNRIICHDLSAQFTSVSYTLTYQETNSSSDSSDLCTKTSTDQSHNCRSTMSDVSYQDKFSSLQTSDRSPTMNPESTIKCSDLSDMSYLSDSSVMCTNTSTDQSDHYRITMPDLSYQGKFNSLHTADKCSAMNPDSTLKYSDSSLSPSDQCASSFIESTNQYKPNTSDLSYDFAGIPSEQFNNFNTAAQDPSKPCPPSNLDSTYQWKNYSSNVSFSPDSSTMCMAASSDPFDQTKTTTGQIKISSLDTSDQCTTMNQDSALKCSVPSLNLSDQSITSFPESTNQCKNHLSDFSHQCTLISSDLTNQNPTIALDPCYQSVFTSRDPSEKYTWPNNLSDVPKHTTSPESSDEYSITSLDHPLDQCITMASDPNDQIQINFPDSSYVDTTTSSDWHDQYKSIFFNSSNPVPSFPESNNHHTSCKTPLHHIMTNSSDSSDLHENDSSDHPCQTALPKTDKNNQLVTNTQNPSLVCRIKTADPHPQNTTLHSDQSLMVSASISDSNSLQLSSPSTPDLCRYTTTSDLPDTSMAIFGDPDLPCTTISLFPSCQHTTTSTESLDICTNISVDFQCENNIECGPLKEPTQDEHGGIIKECECSFLEEVRRIYLDSQVVRCLLIDSGIILIKEKRHLGNMFLMVLRNGKELGTMIQSSKLYLHYQLDKHFLVTQQLNDDWYHAQDRITKVTMLMKKVPIASNWLKTLHNFLCLPNDRGLLTPYAVITDRNGSILFLMEDRDFLGVGIPPLRYELNTMKNLSEVLSFMRYCWIHRVLPGNIINSILYTQQGICFDPSNFCNNEDLCEFKKCLKECLLVFLFSEQQEEFDGIVELLLDRGQQLLEEDWSTQICLARLLTAPIPGTLPFCFPYFSNEN